MCQPYLGFVGGISKAVGYVKLNILPPFWWSLVFSGGPVLGGTEYFILYVTTILPHPSTARSQGEPSPTNNGGAIRMYFSAFTVKLWPMFLLHSLHNQLVLSQYLFLTQNPFLGYSLWSSLIVLFHLILEPSRLPRKKGSFAEPQLGSSLSMLWDILSLPVWRQRRFTFFWRISLR